MSTERTVRSCIGGRTKQAESDSRAVGSIRKRGALISDVSESVQHPGARVAGPREAGLSPVPKPLISGPARATANVSTRLRRQYDSPDDLFRDQYAALSRALTLITGDVHLAEEAVQEAFAQLCLNWARVSKYDDQAAWVRRVAINRATDHRRFVWRKARFLLRLAHHAPMRAPAPPADPQLAEAIRRLPVKQRTAVALFYLADLSLVDVAAAMSISEGAVKRHLSRARNSLRTILEEASWSL